MISEQDKERIEREADEYARTYTGTKLIKRPYIAGATAENLRYQPVVELLIDIRDNYDHDEDAHRYGHEKSQCRKCKATDAINQLNEPLKDN